MEEPDTEQEQPTDAADDAAPVASRLPKMGIYEGLPPRHTGQFEIEQNVSRIATQIAEGRPATYD